MAVIPWSSYTALGAAPATNDILALTDVSDHTQSPQGSTKRMTVANLFTGPAITGGMTVTGTLAAAAITGTTGAFSSTLSVTGAVTLGAQITIGAGQNVTSAAANDLLLNAVAGQSVKLTINGTPKVTVDATSATLATTLAVTGDVAINTNKFTVAASTGNTVVAGTLAVTGAITGTLGTAAQANITSLGTLSTLSVTGDLTINTNKFVVTGSTGTAVSAAFVQGVTGLLTGTGSTGTAGVFDKNGTAMTGSAVAISSAAQGAAAALAVVRGTDGTNAFSDVVHFGGNVAMPPLSQLTITGSPATRTYTSASGTLRLSMSAGYTVACTDHRGITNQ